MNSIDATLNIPDLPPPRPPINFEDPIDPGTPPSVQTIAHLSLLLHAAKAEYTYWGNRVTLLTNLLNLHKSEVVAQRGEDKEQEEWERQLDDDVAAQLFAEMGIDMEAERRVLEEAESRAEMEAELQLLVEAGVLDDSDENWRRAGMMGDELGGEKSLKKPVMKDQEEEQEEENNLDLAMPEPLVGDLSTVMEVTEMPEADKSGFQEFDIAEAALPKSQAEEEEEEVWEEAHGKARWTGRRLLRRNLKTMSDLRGSAIAAAKSQPVGFNNNIVHDNPLHLQPVRRQSLPSIRPATAVIPSEEPKFHHPPTPPPESEPEKPQLKAISLPPPRPLKQQQQQQQQQPKRQTIPTYTPRLSRRLHGQAGPRTVSSTPHLRVSAQAQAPPKPHDHDLKHTSSYPNQIHHQDENTPPSPSSPPPPPYQQTETAPSQPQQPQHELQYDSKTTTISEKTFTPRKLQALMLDLKTPIKQFLPLYASPLPRQDPSNPPQASQAHPSRPQQQQQQRQPLARKLSFSRSHSRLTVAAPATTSTKKDNLIPPNPHKGEAAEGGCITQPPTFIPLYQNDNIEPPTPAGIKNRRKKYGYTSSGVARIVESRSRQYVKDDRWGWKAV